MKTSALMIAVTALLGACAHPITHEQAERELKRSLTCTRNASIDDMKKWVSTLGGTISVQTRFQNGPVSEQNGWMIQLKDPIQIFGQDVSDISIMTASDDYGEYTEYSSLFSGQSIESAAQFSDIQPDYDNAYKEQIYTRDLSIRPESGLSYIVCANNVRSVGKSIRYWARKIDQHINPNGVTVDPESQNNPHRGMTGVENYTIRKKPVKVHAFDFEPPDE